MRGNKGALLPFYHVVEVEKQHNFQQVSLSYTSLLLSSDNFHHVVKWQEGSLVPSHYLDTAKGTMKLLTTFLTLVFACLGECSQHKILCGRTGNGKSYISVLLGCQSDTCDSIESCTKEIKHCSNGVIDTIGLDDDGKEYSVSYNGKNIKLSGLTYPIYALFEHLEKEKIHDVEFYLVFDANNMRLGQSGSHFVDFLTNVINCPFGRILNKFQEIDHSTLRQSGDVIVRLNQQEGFDLQGPSCKIDLPTNWRDFLFSNDLEGLKSSLQERRCDSMKTLISRLKSQIIDTPDRPHDHNNCLYWGETGGRYCNGIKLFGKCSDWEPNRGWKTDHDCVRRRDESNAQAALDNQRKHESNKGLKEAIANLQASLASSCEWNDD
jgi:hypothetical protein